jgi:hypothetical protein
MMRGRTTFIFLGIIAVVSSITLVCLYYNGSSQNIARSPDNQIPLIKDTLMPIPKPQPSLYGKITPPADIMIDLIQANKPEKPLAIVVSATSLVPVSASLITLGIPQIGNEPNRTEVLRSSNRLELVKQTTTYPLGTLPVGKYRFTAIFEFAVDAENSQELAVSKALYMDVRPTEILTSDVSFNQIERIELWDELVGRALMSLRPELMGATRKTLSGEITLMEAHDPGVIERRIAQLRANDPDIARRIMELNQAQADTIVESDLAEQGLTLQSVTGSKLEPLTPQAVRGQPAYEEPAPIPERIRGN